MEVGLFLRTKSIHHTPLVTRSLLTTARTHRLLARRVAPVGPLVAVPDGIEVVPPLPALVDTVVVGVVEAVVETVVLAVPCRH